LVTLQDWHRRNRNRADAGAEIFRRDEVGLNPYKQAIFSHACAAKRALVRCGIGASCVVEHRAMNPTIALATMAASALKGGEIMKTFITALFVVFALAGGTSVMALTGHGSTYLTQSGAYAASNQKATLLY
jgi:hypothetical protein